MRTLRGRLILSHLLPLLVIVPLAGIALLYIVETQFLLNDLAQDLSRQANLIATVANGYPDIWQNPSQALAFIRSVDSEMVGEATLLQPSGEPLASSVENGDATPDEVIDAPVASEQQTGQASVIYSLSDRTVAVYVPVRNIDEELVGIVRVTHELEDISSHFVRLRWLTLGVLAMELVLGSLVGLVLALRLERPIYAVTNAVSEIAAGQRIEPIAEEGPDEIRLLAQAVNTLSDRLKSLEEARRRLLANVVHELGRPLGAIRSAIHALRQGADEDPDVRRELLAGIETELERLQPLLDDLTQLHGRVLGQRELARRSISLNEWLAQLLGPWQAAAREKELAWQVSLVPALPDLWVDPDRLAQALGNLLSNAIKYTPAGGQIAVDAGRSDGEVWIQVADSGPGIAAEEQVHLFDPFFRGRQQGRFPKGLGLGLTIAHELVLAHNGRIEVDSAPERGSRFTIYLPLKNS